MWRVLAVALLAVLAPGSANAQALTVSAASSVADAVAAIGRAFQASGGPATTLNIGGSNFLAKQIVEGAPVHVFVSADAAQMDAVVRSDRIVPGTRRDLLSNQLVVVVPARGPMIVAASALTAPGVRRIAMGNPNSVPAGVYGRQWLEKLKLWTAVQPKIVPMLTVRSALAAVRAGRADAGIVFATDARTAPDVRVALTVPDDEAPDIRYPVAVIRGPREADAARFVQFLAGPDARKVFEAAGFRVLAQ